MSAAVISRSSVDAIQAVLAHFEQRRGANRSAARQQEAEAQERADRDRLRLDQFADRLMLEYRKAGEPPYSWLARDMDVSKATVCRILNGSGKTAPRWWQVNALLMACKVNANTIDEIKRMWIDIRNEQKPISTTPTSSTANRSRRTSPRPPPPDPGTGASAILQVGVAGR